MEIFSFDFYFIFFFFSFFSSLYFHGKNIRKTLSHSLLCLPSLSSSPSNICVRPHELFNIRSSSGEVRIWRLTKETIASMKTNQANKWTLCATKKIYFWAFTYFNNENHKILWKELNRLRLWKLCVSLKPFFNYKIFPTMKNTQKNSVFDFSHISHIFFLISIITSMLKFSLYWQKQFQSLTKNNAQLCDETLK